jgi:biofilm PGA synthesis N-glycosyltransferase PgaC
MSRETPLRAENLPSFVLITPARNEASFIELTIRSVTRQTVLPMKWVIVSDGSTDGTDDIAKPYVEEYDWIELIRMPERAERHFAGKVYAFNAGYELVKGMQYEIIGNLDADISFESDYFAFLLRMFAEDPQLGVAGTPFKEGSKQYDYRFSNIEHVSGACQFFRRECFESIGGYVPNKFGGIDLVAVVTARMKGWKTRTFTGKTCEHHRAMGTADARGFRAMFRIGYQDYQTGVGGIWQFFRSFYQMRNKPIVVGGFALLMGYLWAVATRAKRPVSKDLIEFRRREHMSRLSEFFKKLLPFGGLRQS